MEMGEEVDKIISHITSILIERDLKTTLKHFEDIPKLMDQKNWEAANGQMRTFLESLFNDLCLIILNKPKKGGKARQELQNAKILTTEQANYIFSFMKLSHGEGAHAGLSNKTETEYRWLGCLSLATLGCSFFPKIVRAADALINAGITVPGLAKITDTSLKTKCLTCEESQLLSQCTIYEKEKETFYICKNGCQPIVVIGTPGDKAIEDRGLIERLRY